jgi:hypothetical protein
MIQAACRLIAYWRSKRTEKLLLVRATVGGSTMADLLLNKLVATDWPPPSFPA